MNKPKLLEREIKKRRKRAAELGVDRLIIRVYYEHGFRNFAMLHASAMKPIFPSAGDVIERERDRLDFHIDGRVYAFRVRRRSYNRRDAREVEVFRGEQLVFAVVLARRRWRGRYKTRRITAFVEGDWIGDFERLDREAVAYRAQRDVENEPEVAKSARPLLGRILRMLKFRSL